MSGLAIVGLLGAVLLVLLVGVGQFAFGRPDPMRSNKLMRMRVLFQAVAIALILGMLAFSGTG